MLRLILLLLACSQLFAYEYDQKNHRLKIPCNGDNNACKNIPHAQCFSVWKDVCRCKDGFLPTSDKMNCESDPEVCTEPKCQQFGDKKATCIPKNGEKVCFCNAPTFFSDPKGCLPVFGSNCNKIGCIKDSNTVCEGGKCVCEIGYHDWKKACIRVLGKEGTCIQNPSWCPPNINTKCDGYRCVCKDGFIEQGDVCVQALNSSCSGNDGCSVFANSVCANGKCVCKRGFAEWENQCERVLDGDCKDVPYWCPDNINTICSPDKTCVCKEGFIEQEDVCVQDPSYCNKDNCRKDGDNSATCKSSNKCKCSKEFQSIVEDRKHPTCILKLNSSCDETKECATHDEYSICDGGKCVCKKGYGERKKKCIRVLNSDCRKDYDFCSSHSQLCVENGPNNRTCQCIKGYFEKDNECLSVLNATCKIDENCSIPLHNSVCSTKTRTCVCKTGFYENEKTCSRVLNANCPDEKFCSRRVKNTMCRENKTIRNTTCQCANGFMEKGDTCERGLGSPCNEGKCDFGINNVICRLNDLDKNSSCGCIDGFKETGLSCTKVLNNTCTNTEYCEQYVPDSLCKIENKTSECVCRKGFWENENSTCFKVLNQECYPKQTLCQDRLNKYTGCLMNENIGNTTCQCIEGTIEKKDECITVLNNQCGSDNDCSEAVANSECLERMGNSTCECKEGYYQKDLKCIKVLNSPCDSNNYCSDLVANSECLERMGNWTCECKKGYYQKDLKCTKVLNSPCTYHSDCQQDIVPNFYCMFHQIGKGVCKCQEGYVDNGEQCEKDAKYKPVITMKEIPVWKSKLRLRVERKQKEMAEEAKDEKRTSIWWVYLIVANLVAIGVVVALGVAVYLLPSKQLAETDYDYEDDEESDYSNSDSEEFSETSGSFESETDESE